MCSFQYVDLFVMNYIAKKILLKYYYALFYTIDNNLFKIRDISLNLQKLLHFKIECLDS